MKVKFTKFERVAGLFVLSVILGGVVLMVGVAVKQGWFETKIEFMTSLKNADGIRAGTMVQMAGIRAGQVTDVDIHSDDEIRVRFEVAEKYHSLIHQDSVVRTIRPFIISEKVLDISIGSNDQKVLAAGSTIKSEATADIMDLISGRVMIPHTETLVKMFESVHMIAESILNPERSKDFIRIFDEMAPLLKNMNHMSQEVTALIRGPDKDKGLIRVVQNLLVTTRELNRMLPEINKMTPHIAKFTPILAEEGPKVAGDLAKIAANMAVLTDELQGTLPIVKAALEDAGPEFPRAARRAMEALDETVVTLKALQKSFLLRSNAREVREEEAEQARRERMPAGAKAKKRK